MLSVNNDVVDPSLAAANLLVSDMNADGLYTTYYGKLFLWSLIILPFLGIIARYA
jgi:hypothetical protein